MRILLVEDDWRILRFLKRGLGAEGFQVETAEDGRAAIERAKGFGLDLIILDVLLPDMDGREVCRQLREAQVPVPILLLTALDSIEDKIEGLRMGADDYLTKPFSFEELLARIEALQRRPAEYRGAAEKLSFADIRLDRRTRRIWRGDREIALTAKEFALLDYLMTSGDRVLSRAQILEHVWGYDADPLTNVVDVYIRHLRIKIDAGRERSLIETVRGFGYRLREKGEDDESG